MSASAANELWAVFDARRVKAPEMKGLDSVANGAVGWVKNRRRMLARYKKQAERVEAMERHIPALAATGFAVITHEPAKEARIDHYRRDVVYITSKELVADFLRDQIALGTLRNAAQTSVQMLLRGNSGAGGRLMVPGLFRALVDEADSLLIDEAVTPLIISNSPDDDPNETFYRAAAELAQQLEPNKDFVIDWTVRSVDLTQRGQDKLDHICEQQGTSGFC